MLTGDLINAKHKSSHKILGGFSEQRIDEWTTYRDLLRRGSDRTPVPWLEIPGNHDNFGAGVRAGLHDYFPKYRLEKRNPTERVRTKLIEKEFGSYRIVTVDATLDPGPVRHTHCHLQAPKRKMQTKDEKETSRQKVPNEKKMQKTHRDRQTQISQKVW